MNTKICRSCNLLLDIGQFHKNSNYDDGYLTRCKTCRETLVGKVARQRQMNMKRDLVRRSKDKPCMDCGQSFPTECMDFDHRLNKLFNIGQSLACLLYTSLERNNSLGFHSRLDAPKCSRALIQLSGFPMNCLFCQIKILDEYTYCSINGQSSGVTHFTCCLLYTSRCV